ncbi:hypothetical protein D3C85_1844390 [compost metagenome]
MGGEETAGEHHQARQDQGKGLRQRQGKARRGQRQACEQDSPAAKAKGQPSGPARRDGP